MIDVKRRRERSRTLVKMEGKVALSTPPSVTIIKQIKWREIQPALESL